MQAVQNDVERRVFGVILQLGSHGIGKTVHEDPFVASYHVPPNYQPLGPRLVATIKPVDSA